MSELDFLAILKTLFSFKKTISEIPDIAYRCLDQKMKVGFLLTKSWLRDFTFEVDEYKPAKEREQVPKSIYGVPYRLRA